MLRLAADENFNGDIVRGLLRRNSQVDIVRVQDVGLSGASDPAVLEWAATENRVVVTHDVSTLAGHAFVRVTAGQPMMPGVCAAAGLYGAIAVGVLAAALGGTATQASGPTGPMTVVSASIVAIGIERAGSLDAAMGIILLTFMLGGLMQVGLGLLGVGRYIR